MRKNFLIAYGERIRKKTCKHLTEKVWLDALFSHSSWSITDSININCEYTYEMYGAICYYHDEGSFHYTAFTRDGNYRNEYNDEHAESKRIEPRFINLAFYCKNLFSLLSYSH